MKTITVEPQEPGSASLEDVPEADPRHGSVLVEAMAGEALSCADRSWLARLITRREPPDDFAQALQRRPEDIEVVIQFSAV